MGAIAVALGLVAALAYAYVGYPVAIGFLARLAGRRPPPTDRPDSPMVSICMPVHNGAGYLRAKIASLLEQDYPADRIEILIYCDGCNDETEAIARELAAAPAAGDGSACWSRRARLGKPTGLNAVARSGHAAS